MPAAAFSAPAAVLLVLLPPPAVRAALPAGWLARLAELQGQLGAAVRVLTIDEATHPTVVRSFGAPPLPACVLMRQGVELWRQTGLPSADTLHTVLLAAAPLS